MVSHSRTAEGERQMEQPYRKYIKALLNLVSALAILLFTIFIVPRFLGFFMPFVIGWLIAAIANPLVRFLDEKIKIKRKTGSAIVIIAVIALIILAGYWAISTLVRELVGFIGELPDFWRMLQADFDHAGSVLEGFSKYLSPQLQSQLASILESIGSLFGSLADMVGTPTVNAVGNFAKNIPGAIVGIIMCLLASYFFVAEHDEVVRVFHKLMPQDFKEKWSVMYGSLKRAVGGYFMAQFKIEVWMYLLLLIGFLVLQVSYAPLIALVIAILDFFPVFGTGTVLLPWAVIKLLGGDYKLAVGLIIIWLVGQLARQLIQPKIVGDSVGLPALPTLILIFIGYKVGSVLGMILAVPVGIILVNMYQAGFFNTTIDSVKILVVGFNNFRCLNDRDRAGIRKKKSAQEDECPVSDAAQEDEGEKR